MRRLKLAYGLLIGAMLGSAACEDLKVCDGGWCMTIDICNPMTEDCGEVDTGTEELCPDGEIVDDWTGCLMDDAFCYELPDGRFCTGPDAPVCPDGYEQDTDNRCDIADYNICITASEGLDGYLTELYTIEECHAAGGEAISDPGDGSVTTVGCPSGLAPLAYIDAGWDEGGLCCEWLPD